MIGDRIKKLRKLKGISQLRLAEKLNIDQSYLSKIENNKQDPSLSAAKKIADALEVEEYELFGEKVHIPELEHLTEWMVFAEEMERKELTPLQIKTIIEALGKLK